MVKIRHDVYFLTDSIRKHSYIGYSPYSLNRYRCHVLKHKASARRTKSFDSVHLLARIENFPTKSIGLSFEYYAKTKKKLLIRNTALQLPQAPHFRLKNLFAPLLYDKFKKLKQDLTIIVNDPEGKWSKDISLFYNVEVKQMQIPYHPSHVDPKKKFK